jgi:LysM repeat protein
METTTSCSVPTIFILLVVGLLTFMGFTVSLPDGSAPADPLVIVVTATSDGAPPPVNTAAPALTNTPSAPDTAGATAFATIDPTLLPPPDAGTATLAPPSPAAPIATASPTIATVPIGDDGCPRYIVVVGDTIARIAAEFGVEIDAVLALNSIDDPRRLQIGQELLIPVPGCEPPITDTPTPTIPPSSPTPTMEPFDLVTPGPTDTPPPTAVSPQVAITGVQNPGDLNTEAVEMRNMGATFNLQSWTLIDSDGNLFRFPAYRLQQGTRVVVYTRSGNNTPGALYWGQDDAMWRPGETVTLSDSTGQVRATFQVSADQQ